MNEVLSEVKQRRQRAAQKEQKAGLRIEQEAKM
jgi:hypothetical protein